MKTAYIAIHFTVTHSLYCIVYRFKIYMNERGKVCVSLCEIEVCNEIQTFQRENDVRNQNRQWTTNSIKSIDMENLKKMQLLAMCARARFIFGRFSLNFFPLLTTQLINICRFFNDLISPTSFFSLEIFRLLCVLAEQFQKLIYYTYTNNNVALVLYLFFFFETNSYGGQ